MNTLHQHLAKYSEWYANWHNHPRHQFHHWVAFLAVAIILTASSLSGISQFASGEDGLASGSAMPLAKGKPVINPGFQFNRAIPEPAQDHILVKFKNSVGQARRAEVLAKHGFSEKFEIKDIGVKLVDIPDSVTPEEAVQNLQAQDAGNIDFAEVDGNVVVQVVPNDPNYSSQWYLPKISAPGGWDISNGMPNVIVAMIDSGLNPSDPEFSPKLVPGWNFVSGNSTIVDNNGHGSATTLAAAAATNNNYNAAGVAWNNQIMPLVVCDSSGSCSWSKVASAITWAADHGAKVINMSLGGTSDSSAMQSAVNYAWSKGLVIVAAACNYATSNPCYPAAEQNVVAVSATDSNNNLASFSNYGSYIDVAAPGVSINGWSGTSFSSPIAAGVAALIFSANPALTNSQVVSLMESNADDLGTAGWDQYFGYGLVDVAKALAAAGQVAIDATPPSVPTNLTASAISSSQVSLSWSVSTDNVGVAGYQVFRNGSKIATVSNSPYADNSVAGSTTYSYQIYAVDTSGNVSAGSNTATATTPAAVVKLSITTSQVSGKTATSAIIKWTTNIPSTGSIRYGTSKTALNSTLSDSTVGTSHSVTLTGLSKFTTYYYQIAGVSQDGSSSAASSVSSFKTARK